MFISELDSYINQNIVISRNVKENLHQLTNIVNLMPATDYSLENIKLVNLIKNNSIFSNLISIIAKNYNIDKIKNSNVESLVRLYCDVYDINIFEHIDLAEEGIFCDEAFKAYLRKIGKIRKLGKEEEYNLAVKAINGDFEARNTLIKHNLRFVVFIAKRYANKGISMAELVAEGNIGLFKAIDKYNPFKGFRFETYAGYWIRQTILNMFPRDRIIRVPVNVNLDHNKIIKFENEMLMELNKNVSEEEIASHVGISKERVRDTVRAFLDVPSINQPIDEDDENTLSDYIEDHNCLMPEDKNVNDMLKDYILEYLELLTDEEKKVILLRHPLDGSEEYSLEEIGKKLNESRDTIRNIENKAYRKLRKKNKLRELANDYIPDLNLQPYVKKKKKTF